MSKTKKIVPSIMLFSLDSTGEQAKELRALDDELESLTRGEAGIFGQVYLIADEFDGLTTVKMVYGLLPVEATRKIAAILKPYVEGA